MDGGHIAESNVIASSHGGEHTGHVVEENLNRALGRRVLVLPLARVEGGVRYWAWRQRCSSIFQDGVDAGLGDKRPDWFFEGGGRGGLPSILFCNIRPLLGLCV